MAFLIGTTVSIGHGLFDPINRLELGAALMAASAEPSGKLKWQVAKVVHTGPARAPDGPMALISLSLPRNQNLLVSPDQPLYVGDGECVPAERALLGGAPLIDRDGRRVEILEARPMAMNGQFFEVIVGDLNKPKTVDGHLILAGGVVCGDAAVARYLM